MNLELFNVVIIYRNEKTILAIENLVTKTRKHPFHWVLLLNNSRYLHGFGIR